MLQGTPGTAREVKALLEDLEPTLPILLGNAVSINQVAVSHLNGLEQLLVSYPRVIGAGPSGSTADGYGHVNLQFDQSPVCTDGLPAARRSGARATTSPTARSSRPSATARSRTTCAGRSTRPARR